MIIYELTGTEADPVYQALEAENGIRQYDFLNSIVSAALRMQRTVLSQQVIKALNYQAITCLHINAGEYRPCPVWIDGREAPAFYRVPALMDDLVNLVNHAWTTSDPIQLATHVLWKLNYIHPFINGNGRTARAAAHFVICMASGGPLPGAPILPELLKRDRVEYCNHLQHAHNTYATGKADLAPLHGMMQRLVREQLASAGIVPAVPATSP